MYLKKLADLNRSMIGADSYIRELTKVLESNNTRQNFPPYNIIRLGEDAYTIEVALAGYTSKDVNITLDNNVLYIRGGALKRPNVLAGDYIHTGIASRSFERVFQLAEHVEVGEASFENGILQIQLSRVIPESMKPKNIPIKGNTAEPMLLNETDKSYELKKDI